MLTTSCCAPTMCQLLYMCVSPSSQLSKREFKSLPSGHRVGKSACPPPLHAAVSPTTQEVRAWPHTSRPLHTDSLCISGMCQNCSLLP